MYVDITIYIDRSKHKNIVSVYSGSILAGKSDPNII